MIYTNKSHRNTTISKQLRFKRNLKALSHDAFKKELQKSWLEILKIEDENTDTSLEILLILIHVLLDIHIPLIKMKNKETKLQNKPLICQEILKNIDQKNKLNQKYFKANDPVRKEQLHEEFKALRNAEILSQTSKKKTKKTITEDTLKDNKLSPRKTWNEVKGIVNLKKSNKYQPKCIKIIETYITDQDEIAKKLLRIFWSINGKIDKKTSKPKRKITDNLKHGNLNSFFPEPISKKETQKIISNTANNKAVGPYRVPISLLKQFKEEQSTPLLLIINAP